MKNAQLKDELFILEDCTEPAGLYSRGNGTLHWILNPSLLPKELRFGKLEFALNRRVWPTAIEIIKAKSSEDQLRFMANEFRKLADSLWREPKVAGRPRSSKIDAYARERSKGLPAQRAFAEIGVTDTMEKDRISRAYRSRKRRERAAVATEKPPMKKGSPSNAKSKLQVGI